MSGAPANEIGLQSRLVASTEQVSCEIDDETVILSLRTGEYYGLNPVAAQIWQLLQEEQTVADVRDALLREYDVDEGTCTEQVFAVLREMLRMQLLDMRGAG